MAIFDRLLRRGNVPETRPEDARGLPRNPSGLDFLNSAKHSISKAVEKHSVTAAAIAGGYSYTRGGNPFGSSGALTTNSDVDLQNGGDIKTSLPVDTNKISRIQSYDNISRYPELDWCIDEIANDFLHPDVDGEYMKLRFDKSRTFTNDEDAVLQDEFKHLVSLYDLRTNAYNMIRKFLIEGELCFENVIDSKHKEYGIIGFKYMPTMFYDFLRSKETGQIVGLYIDPERIKTYSQFSSFAGNGYAGGNTQIFNAVRSIPAYTYTYSMDMTRKIPMPFEQVTYMNSGVLSEDGSIVFPPIDKVTTPVRQLLLMHDALVIYRITRAPEKLAFNIDLTGMPAKKARETVRRLSMEHKSRKAVQGSGAVTNVYNAETMLDAYYFWKVENTGGTTVSNLSTNVHYNELHDVEYFLKRVLKFLHIPWQRWAESQANRQDRQSIQNEEYSFAQSIVRYQTLFSSAVKKTFVTHLKLKGLWDKFDLHEGELEVEMIPPAIFELYQAQQRFNDVLDILVKSASLDFLSKNLLLRKLLNMTDQEIAENENEVRREALKKAQTEFAVQQIQGGNPNVFLDVSKYLIPQTQPPAADGVPTAQGAAPTPEGGQPSQNGPSEEDVAKAEAAFKEFSDEGANVSVAPSARQEVGLAGEDDAQDAAQKVLPENPEFGDYGIAASGERKSETEIYPESQSGAEELEREKSGAAGPSLSDAFDAMFREKPMSPNGGKAEGAEMGPPKSLSAVFDAMFAKSGTEGGSARKVLSGGLTDVFRRSFRRKAEKSAKASGGAGEEETLSAAMKDMFGQ